MNDKFALTGVPPLVSRRVLETLTFLARNHPFVAKIFLQFSRPQPFAQPEGLDQTRGKAVMVVEEGTEEKLQHQEGYLSITSLLSLLNQPLYLRSIAHLEQVMSASVFLFCPSCLYSSTCDFCVVSSLT